MKRAAKIALILLLILSTALAAGGHLSINSGQSLDTQFSAFRKYLDELPDKDRDLWLLELTAICQEDHKSAEGMVWIPKSGKKFHSHAGCSGMRDPRQVSRQEAIGLGFEPCKRCKP